ncbi:uncharacterized protein LOC120825237 [Gasterosteus aculeatus]|uniref:retinitis pigmentosa 1-like 1 protein isoform X2 n=1 Tax=Gasterosteus aculeatus aculeatus TaxID=481459 RepID=UPI001A98844C|nr:retinitis pigmentosa 1-like 1 protein isoform X2 [Gasterosteus aculeatus aculeatus]
MEYCFLTGFLVVLLLQRCTCEGHSTSIQSSTVVPLHDGPTVLQEPEPPAEVVPAVAPPSLKEVQQAVQEASEQVETRGAEEVLKVLLERVVEAAWGQVEVAGEVKADEEAVREEDALEPEKEEVETNAEVLEKAVEGEDVVAQGDDNDAGEEQEVAVVDAVEYVSEEGKGVEEGEGETVTGSVEETGVGVEAEGEEVINKSSGIEYAPRTVEDTVLEEVGGHLKLAEAGPRVGIERAVLSEEKSAAQTERPEVEETPAVVEEAVAESNTSLPSVGDVWGNEETQVDEMEGDAIVPHSDDLESTQSVVGEKVEEINIEEDAKEPEVEDEQGHLVAGGVAAEDEGAEATPAREESLIKGESVELANEGGDPPAGEEEQMSLETSHGDEKEDQEVLVISAPEPQDAGGASVEPSPENQAFTPGTFPGVGEPEENALGEEAYNNEIIDPTDVHLPHDAVEPQAAPDHSVKVLAEPPQAEGEEPGEANELLEEAAGNKETAEPGLEPWKIGAISAAAFLVLETIIIVVYILKCRNKNSTAGIQRACEEGCVEPEDATGGDGSDDTLPASNRDAQQIAALDAFQVPSTAALNKGQKEEERAVAMSDLPPSSAEESACSGPGPDCSQDLRTSIL